MLFQAVPVSVHRVDVHHAVAVGKEVDPSVPEHRIVRGSGPVGGQRHGLRTGVVAPDVLRRAALVAFGLTRLPVVAREEKRVAVRRVARFRRLGQRNHLAPAAAVDGHQLGVGQSGVAAGADQHAPIGRPAGHCGVTIPGAALGQAALHRHGIDFRRTFVFGAEGDGLAVRGNRGSTLPARIRRQPPRGAALHAHGPEIALRREDDRVAVNRRVAVIAGARIRGIRGTRDEQQERHRR